MIGRRIGHYEIIHRLGEGGVGQVFAAIDRALDRPVAIKALRPEHSRDRAFVGRFKVEAGVLASLNHPNIATIHSLEQVGEDQFMILELVRGITLEALLAMTGRLSETAALAVAAQALSGLAAAHAAGIVHRDIKAANLMVTPAGAVKLMDFGIARVRGSGRMTRHGHVVGTLAYMSPEQIQGQEGDARSDIYSLGIVLYEMVVGKLPFEADTDYDLLKAQVELPPPPLQDHVPGLSRRIQDAIMRCLEKDPARRFANAEAAALALGTRELRDPAGDILRSGTGPLIERATLPLARIVDEARGRPGRSAPPHSAVRPSPATRYVASPSRLPEPSPGPVRVRTGAKLPANRGGWPPFLAVGAALMAVLGAVAAMLIQHWAVQPMASRPPTSIGITATSTETAPVPTAEPEPAMPTPANTPTWQNAAPRATDPIEVLPEEVRPPPADEGAARRRAPAEAPVKEPELVATRDAAPIEVPTTVPPATPQVPAPAPTAPPEPAPVAASLSSPAYPMPTPLIPSLVPAPPVEAQGIKSANPPSSTGRSMAGSAPGSARIRQGGGNSGWKILD